jgi:hypothetical protein
MDEKTKKKLFFFKNENRKNNSLLFIETIIESNVLLNCEQF